MVSCTDKHFFQLICKKHWKDDKRNSLHLARKYARSSIFLPKRSLPFFCLASRFEPCFWFFAACHNQDVSAQLSFENGSKPNGIIGKKTKPDGKAMTTDLGMNRKLTSTNQFCKHDM